LKDALLEFDLIARIRQRAATRSDVILGIGDDAAILSVPPGKQLVIAMDTLNSGVHFPVHTAPADIGWKALAVNLSDLAAMAATPAWCTLSLSLPQPDAAWLDEFLDGFLTLAVHHDIALIGGDTTRGPLSVCVTVHGLIDPRGALLRSGARIGDDVWVTGTLGDAAGALRQWQAGGPSDAAMRMRLDRPTPRVEAGLRLAGIAHACIDISDGLVADLGHVCRASRVGVALDIDALPASDALLRSFDIEMRRELQTAGGDDYELCFTAPKTARLAVQDAMHASDLPVTRVGRITGDAGKLVLRDGDGIEWLPPRAGYVHFED
jgi:thiamine-monophosphate kinase